MDRRALTLGVLAVLAWSTVFVFGKLAISRHAADPLVLGLYRFAGSGAILVLFMVMRGKGRALAAFGREPFGFLLLGLTGCFGMGFLIFLSLQHTTSITAQLIMNSNPVLIVPLSLFIGERVGVPKIVGVALGVAGCALVLNATPADAAAEGSSHLVGGLLAASSALCWAVYTVFGRGIVRRHGGLTATTISIVLGGVFFLAACLLMRKNLVLGWHGALTGIYLAVVPTALAFTAWFVALEKLPANVLGPLQFLAPVTGVVLAIVLLGEELTLAMALGAALALCGVYLATRNGRSRKEATT